MKLLDSLKGLFDGKAKTASATPAEQDKPSVYVSDRLLMAVTDAAKRNDMTYVNETLERPEVKKYIEKNLHPGSILTSFMQSTLAYAVVHEDKQLVRRLLDMGVNPQTDAKSAKTDALFVAAAGQIPESFDRGSGSWRSLLPTSNTAAEIFKMVFENCRDRWGVDRVGFVNSLNQLKSLPKTTSHFYYGRESVAAGSSYAGIMDGAREGILEVLKSVDPEIHRFKEHLPALLERLKTPVGAPGAPAV